MTFHARCEQREGGGAVAWRDDVTPGTQFDFWTGAAFSKAKSGRLESTRERRRQQQQQRYLFRKVRSGQMKNENRTRSSSKTVIRTRS